MSIVAIVGAGPLGGAIAHKLAARDRFHEVRLIDAAGGVAAGKALDIQQASAVECFRTRLTADTEIDAVSGATVVVIADREPGVDGDKAALTALTRTAALNRHAVLVCADPSHRSLIGRGVAELAIPRRRLIGSAPAAFQSALRAIVGVELRCSASEVSLTVLGRPPERAVVPWGTATVHGYALSSQLSAPRLARLAKRVETLGAPGPYATASATARVCEAVCTGSGMKGLSVFYVLDGELGGRRTTAAVSVELDSRGVARVLEPSLTLHERVQLDTILQQAEV